MHKFIAIDQDGNPTAFAPGVPARDLEDHEYAEHVKAGRIVEGQQTGDLWEKDADTRSAKPSGRAAKEE